MAYAQDWDTAEQKLKSLFPDKTVRGKIRGILISKEEDRRLLFFRDEDDEVVKASLEVLLPAGALTLDQVRQEIALTLAADERPSKRHKTAWTEASQVPDAVESRLWEAEVMQNNIPRHCGDVDSMLVPERPLLSDVRYVHLLDLARRLDTTGIITMKRGRKRQQADRERDYDPALLRMLQAAASGQPGISFHPEVTDPKDRAKADVRCFIHNNEAEAIEAKSRESSAKAADPEGIDSNRAAFGKRPADLQGHLYPLPARHPADPIPRYLANRIDAVYFAAMHFNEQQQMTTCTVAPPIPRQGLRPSSMLCRDLDKMPTFFPRPHGQAQPKVTLAEFLLVGGASPAPGWPLLVRYVDTLCGIHGIPPVACGLQYADGRPFVDISTGTVVARGAKSIMIELPGCDNTFKVGPYDRIMQDYDIHNIVDEVEGIRRTAPGGCGRVTGVEDIGFIELEGRGTPINIMRDPVKVATACNVLQKALEGMHAKGVLHRDVSQGNIIKINSQIKLNDFDISTVSDTTKEQLVARCGTPGFISPYWHKGLPFCKEYDCHALGLAMAAMLRLSEAGAAKLRLLWQCEMVPKTFKTYCVPLNLRS